MDRSKAVELRRKRLDAQKAKFEKWAVSQSKLVDTLGSLEFLIRNMPEQDFSDLIEALDKLEGIKTVILKLDKTLSEFKIDFPQFPKTVKLANPEVKTQVKLIKEDDIFDTYKPADSDEESESEKYYSFLNQKGAWFVLREFGSKSKNWRYAAGLNDYRANWNRRKVLDYGYYDEVRL